MTWIDDDAEELKRMQQSVAELEARNRLIAEHAEAIYNYLWNEIRERIGEATEKGYSNLLTNGGPFQRKIIATVLPKPTQTHTNPKEALLKLGKDKLSILITGEVDMQLTLDLGEDNVVFIKHAGEHRSIQEAAKLILRPLLFPKMFTQK